MIRRHRSFLVTAGLLVAMVAIFSLSMWLNRNAPTDSRFVGTDTAATEHIEQSHPGYKPWFKSVFTPKSGEIESGLFAMQAAAGAGVFGFALGALWQRRRESARGVSDDTSARGTDSA